MTDYSQFGEQRHILDALSVIDNGRFLDIGAFHPTDKSNTRALFEMGWSGVMVEPSPGPMLSLLTEYGNEPRIQLILALACPGAMSMQRLHASDAGVATAVEAEYDRWKDRVPFQGSVMVPGIGIPALLRLGPFAFVSIDAEGMSIPLLAAIIEYGHLPQCICVEHNAREREAASIYAPFYRLVYRNMENLILSLL